jgi:hypothetical protein
MGFWDRMDEFINEGLSSSRQALRQAREKAMDLGEKGMLRYEILQLNRQAAEKLSRVGIEVYEELVEKDKKSVSRESLSGLLEEIRELKQRIESREKELKQVGEGRNPPG